MDLLYAITLIVALASGAVAILTSVLGLIDPKPLWAHLTKGALILGCLCLSTSVVVHSQWGHGPGTVAPMDLGGLLSEHEAFQTTGAILLLGLVLAIYRSRRLRPVDP